MEVSSPICPNLWSSIHIPHHPTTCTARHGGSYRSQPFSVAVLYYRDYRGSNLDLCSDQGYITAPQLTGHTSSDDSDKHWQTFVWMWYSYGRRPGGCHIVTLGFLAKDSSDFLQFPWDREVWSRGVFRWQSRDVDNLPPNLILPYLDTISLYTFPFICTRTRLC